MKLIDKDALVAEIEKLIDKGKYHDDYNCVFRDGNNAALYALKERLDTLEVKEVDFQIYVGEELENFLSRHKVYDDLDIAKHFFELGLKAKKKNNYNIRYK